MDANGIILRANQWELDTLGYERNEYVGRHIAEFHADPEVIADILERLGRNETLHEYPARLRAKDGSIRHVVINSNVRRGEQGEFMHTRCFTRDVTARTVAERALSEATTDLERKVAERTAQLERANRELEPQREQLVEAQRIAQLGSWEWDVASGEVVWSDELLAIFDVVATRSSRPTLRSSSVSTRTIARGGQRWWKVVSGLKRRSPTSFASSGPTDRSVTSTCAPRERSGRMERPFASSALRRTSPTRSVPTSSGACSSRVCRRRSDWRASACSQAGSPRLQQPARGRRR